MSQELSYDIVKMGNFNFMNDAFQSLLTQNPDFFSENHGK